MILFNFPLKYTKEGRRHATAYIYSVFTQCIYNRPAEPGIRLERALRCTTKCFDFCAKPVEIFDLRDRVQTLSLVVGMRFWVYIFYSKPVEICDFKNFHSTSKMTTFCTRSPSVSCDSTVLFQFRTDIDFLRKARGNL